MVRLRCPDCGFELGGLVAAHPEGPVRAIVLMAVLGTVCCGYLMRTEELKEWTRIVAPLPRAA